MFTVDRVVLRSVLICTIGVTGILYELIKINPPRWLLVAGYGAIITLSLFRLSKRPLSQDEHEATNHT